MNIVLLPQDTPIASTISITEPRQVQHIQTHLKLGVGDTLKVGIRNELRYLTQITAVSAQTIDVQILKPETIPRKRTITLVLALPRPKVLRRIIMDAVTLGVEKIILIHSYRVDKSYWQSPLLAQIDDYITLGLEQAGDTVAPQVELHKRFKPFVEDVLSGMVCPEQPVYVAHPYATTTHEHMAEPCCLVIGPEGGFIDYEVELFKKNGCQTVSLGNRILRTETAIPYVLGSLSI
ncbi:16S rRNA (uracil(1498)-N(3))-methyltransferase [Acinetobacter rathckeae]|uniref:16S rRNA (uracil(1498)-N(3))-methyltransferase n=1 Tax=Acinetobacter rathckeae TaxID=2605272 RepID=UPI0018A32E69|nr:16S rRNA (uracil(1498)-N(3))-methyltransferase [Acinetobacter rathckeae]MBF7688203.1 16S rRNA (uracil(1498)-N(3))-methyltransferase [Acinetobacter rathckeae]MBF7695278.1 16S rRNA (uracil(1498)-N(3))-methyltransferase [Acinetobacter rathckeae]